MTRRGSLGPAVKMAEDLARFCKARFPDVFLSSGFHSWDYLVGFCESIGAHLVLDRVLPGQRRKAAVMFVAGIPFIIIDKSIRPGSRQAMLALAHELGHVVLQHRDRPSFAEHGLSETMDQTGMSLQFNFHNQTELEANIAALYMMAPDAYLDNLVEQTSWIQSKNKSIQHDVPVEWFAIRVQLYREIFGYDRTLELLAARPTDPFSQVDVRKWECTDNNLLELFLARINAGSFAWGPNLCR